MYLKLFEILFPLVGRLGMSPAQDGIYWQHIHRRGVEAVVVDMCHKQASGKGY
jgi:hypothetical protein